MPATDLAQKFGNDVIKKHGSFLAERISEILSLSEQNAALDVKKRDACLRYKNIMSKNRARGIGPNKNDRGVYATCLEVGIRIY